jgi:hypothetical protein
MAMGRYVLVSSHEKNLTLDEVFDLCDTNELEGYEESISRVAPSRHSEKVRCRIG